MSTPRSTLLAPLVLMTGALSVLTATPDAGVVSIAIAQTSATHKFSVTIKNGKADRGTVRVTQGEQVEITLSSDQPTELHMHGYDLSAQPEPGMPGTFSFVAKIAGRFPVEAHRTGPAGKGRRHPGALFYVEVYPP
jgi:FtsP/CotA-like multicopper oxidase with cupredoxin domain